MIDIADPSQLETIDGDGRPADVSAAGGQLTTEPTSAPAGETPAPGAVNL